MAILDILLFLGWVAKILGGGMAKYCHPFLPKIGILPQRFLPCYPQKIFCHTHFAMQPQKCFAILYQHFLSPYPIFGHPTPESFCHPISNFFVSTPQNFLTIHPQNILLYFQFQNVCHPHAQTFCQPTLK